MDRYDVHDRNVAARILPMLRRCRTGRQPTNTTVRLLNDFACRSTTPPFAPTTPAHSGCDSARLPLPLTVVHTGAFNSSAIF